MDPRILLGNIDDIVAAINAMSPFILLVALSLAACFEYVFPPFPGDVIAVGGGFLAAKGDTSIALTIAGLVVGSIIGAAIAWCFGRFTLRNKILHAFIIRFFPEKQIARLHVWFEHYGTLVLLGNRFLPGVRAVVMVAAGMAEIRLAKVVFLGGISALLWISALVGLGVLVGNNLEAMFAIFITYNYVMYILLGVIIVGAISYALWSKNK